MKTPLIISLTLLLAACATGETQVETKVEAAQPKQIEESRAVAKTLATQLGGKLKESLNQNGPAQSISVCKEIAPQIAADLSKQTGWQVSRVGTRARNAKTGVPNAWQAQALASFAERMKNGEKADTMEFAEVVTDAIRQAPALRQSHRHPAGVPDLSRPGRNDCRRRESPPEHRLSAGSGHRIQGRRTARRRRHYTAALIFRYGQKNGALEAPRFLFHSNPLSRSDRSAQTVR